MASLHERVLRIVVFTGISASTTTGLATSLVLGNLLCYEEGQPNPWEQDPWHNILPSASGRKSMGSQVLSKAWIQSEHWILISKMYISSSYF